MGQSASRLWGAVLNSVLGPTIDGILRAAGQRRAATAEEELGRRRQIPPDLSGEELSTLGGRTTETATGGRGTPNSGGGGATFFGSHFLMGGELYDTSKPEVFLFGDQQDLELLGNKPVKFPHSLNGVTDSVGVLNALVNVRRDSVKFTRVGRAGGGYSSGFYRLEFIFDCDVSCFVQIHFCAKEVVEEHQIQISSRQPQLEPSERFHFPVGSNQQFSHFMFKPHRYDMKLMHWDGGLHFPVLIEIRSVSDQYPEQVQTTLCSIERSADQSAALILKPLKQKLISNGVVFLLQEIFGIENKENADTAPMVEENGAECIICMANPRDTMILPCRHLCICNGCAETLRYKLNNCPICRSPFKALMKIRAMRNSLIGQGMGADGTVTATRIRREPLTLVEAINGPFSNTATHHHHHHPHFGGGHGAADVKSAAAAAAMIARCKGNSVVTTTTTAHVHAPPSASQQSTSPTSPFSASMPIGLYQQQKQIAVSGGGGGGIVDWLKSKEFHQGESSSTARQAAELAEHIEMEQFRNRKGSHSGGFLRYSPSSSMVQLASYCPGSRSPSLCRASQNPLRHSHSHFSTSPNSSYQSARSIVAQQPQQNTEDYDENGSSRRKRPPVPLLLASAPDLSSASIDVVERRSDLPTEVALQLELEQIALAQKEERKRKKKQQPQQRQHPSSSFSQHGDEEQRLPSTGKKEPEGLSDPKPAGKGQKQRHVKRRSEPPDNPIVGATAKVTRTKCAKLPPMGTTTASFGSGSTAN